ncbi:uncharacterized protein Z518_09127 [Rhinocladiella mackenziei CBS 650.93]|uniref:AB hydrolase-1 domain-containing protein n=1 Tax=Rhinocladiella mackenziei CBS 650.93 TaxID=1442369 RepID=A0A0D2IDS5_9EURO|nr:uncharacterized protein Z518_09127 [Rhinocladiella mackenziei CBS 650.93]KIX01401.1 hypothetical protein Z518_09127 [Rhinocladiella mackenziei CBS 650.93]
MAPQPSIVIVPGSFSFASMYYGLVNKIQEHGYEVFVNNLPSASRNPPEEPASMNDDAVFFRGIIENLANQGKDVLVMTHSYGGLVGTEAVKGVGKAERQAKGHDGGVVRLVYLTSSVLAEGASTKTERGDPPPELVEMGKDGFMKIVGVEAVAQGTFPDLELDKAVEIVKMMPKHSALSFEGQLTYPAYKYIPASYIFCENDFIIPPDKQREYIERIKRESGKDVDVHTLSTGHGPNVTAPGVLANVIVDIAAKSSAQAACNIEQG